jgi:8-oxo-dGTP diphosphatase
MENDTKYRRLVQTSVTNFLFCGDKWLFLKRSPNKRVDPNRLNGIGGRLEIGETFLEAAIRETKEETGYDVTEKDIELAGVVKLIGGYPEDWDMCFFRISVPSMNIPKENAEEDNGTLVWIDKDKVLDSEYELVDDLNYCFKDILANDRIFFLTAILDDSQKITHTSISYLKK